MNRKHTSATHIAVFVVYTMLTASIVSAQTGGGDDFTPPTLLEPPTTTTTTPPSPAPEVPASTRLCPWDDVEDDPELARSCLREAGVNVGLGAYAFSYDVSRPRQVGGAPIAGADEPPKTGGGEVEGAGADAAGLVTRWAMVAALMQAIGQINQEPTPAWVTCGRFADIGFLSREQQTRICQAAAAGITDGFPDGTFRPYDTVPRWQMALFFVRFLLHAGGTEDSDSPLRLLWEATPASDGPFADVDFQPDHLCVWGPDTSKAVNMLHALEITKGTGADEATELQPVCGTGEKPDLKPHPHWTRPGLLQYEPRKQVTGDQMARFVVRLLAYTVLEAGEEDNPVTQEEPRYMRYQDRYADDMREWFLEEIITHTTYDAYRPIPWSPLTRPPRELNWASIVREQDTEWLPPDVGENKPVWGFPVSLQPGDWFWDSTGTLRVLYTVVTLGYHEFYPGVVLRFCGVEGPHAGRRIHKLAAQVGKNLFRIKAAGQAPGDCDISGYDIPEPSEYTRNRNNDYPIVPALY